MPIYEYEFTHPDGSAERFETIRPFATRDEPTPAPSGLGFGKRVPSLPAAQVTGMTAAEKKLGTTSSRREWGKYMRDARDKRKQNYSPSTREGFSNELWVGNEVRDSVIAAPTQKQMGSKAQVEETVEQRSLRKDAAESAARTWAAKDAGKSATAI